LDLHELKKTLQSHLTDGLVIIVGSGLSSSEGIPGMGELATHLLASIPSRLRKDSVKSWESIGEALKSGVDLESALLKHPPSSELEVLLVESTVSFLLPKELEIIGEVVQGKRTLRFSKLLTHLLKPNTGIPVVTTNYDRLVEVAAEASGLGVDSLFVGHHLGRVDQKESQFSLCRGITQRKKGIYLNYAEHIVVLKPHGSLDWFLSNGVPVRCSLQLEGQRLIITPGINKFRGGYDRPFDAHRERANREIDRAARYLIIGYGFNDDHLQTHLEHQLLSGKPALLLSRGLSQKAKELTAKCSGVMALCNDDASGGCRYIKEKSEEIVPGLALWDLEVFIKEVLEP
jgi:hypothetical protein